MKTKHTPGPWAAQTNNTSIYAPVEVKNGYTIYDMHGWEICSINGVHAEDPDNERMSANARLIAVSPLMFKALEDLLAAAEYELNLIGGDVGLQYEIAAENARKILKQAAGE